MFLIPRRIISPPFSIWHSHSVNPVPRFVHLRAMRHVALAMDARALHHVAMPAPGRPLYRVAFGGTVALALGLGFGRFAFTPLLPMMQADAGVTILSGSWLAAGNYLGYLLGALAGVRWRLESPFIIRVGLLTVALTTLAMGVTTDHLAWLLLRALAGGATACILVATSAWTLARLALSGQNRLIAMVFGGVGVGIVVAGTLVLAAMAAGLRSSETWVILGLVALAATGASWNTLLREAKRPDGQPERPAVWRRAELWSIYGRARLVVACYGAFGFAYIIPATFLPAAARQVVPDPLLFGWSWPLFGVAGALSTLAAGQLADRWSDRDIWIGSYVVMALGIALPAFDAGLGALFLSSLAAGGSFLVITMTALREAQAVAGAAAPELIAAMTAAFAVGQCLGPLAAGYLLELEGSFAPALLAAATLLLGSAAILTLEAHRSRAIPAVRERRPWP
jgi:predicted MFS family arabinose efflux permease